MSDPQTQQTDVATQTADVIDAAIAAGIDESKLPAIVREPLDHTRPRLIQPVEISLDRTRHLRLPFWALKMFQERTGISAWDNDKVFGWPPDLTVITTLLWCGLLDEDPDLTLEQVERLPGLEFGNIYYLLHCLDECWGRNTPAPEPRPPSAEEGPDPNPNRAPRRTG